MRAGAPIGELTQRRVAFMRYKGQGHEIEIELGPQALSVSDATSLTANFEAEYQRQFGRRVPGMTIEVLNWGLSVSSSAPTLADAPPMPTAKQIAATSTRRVWCNIEEDWRDAGVFDRADLRPGDTFDGPALIVEPQTTTFVSSDFRASIDSRRNIWMTTRQEART